MNMASDLIRWFAAVTFLLAPALGKMEAVVKMSQSQHVEEIIRKEDPRGSYDNMSPDGKSFSFASYYTDHMVLQRAPKRAVIWGYALNIGERIIIKVSDRGIYTTKVYQDPMYGYGVWKIKLPAEASAGPFTIMAISSEKTIQLTDVMFGDVWVCSGQSNMQFTTVQAFNGTEEVKEANNYPNIRLFTVADIPSSIPVPDLLGIWEKWSPASTASVGGAPWKYFSAVCWLYGKALYKELGYPIGLIDTTWGGTRVEAWSSPDALAKCGIKSSFSLDIAESRELNKNGLLITPEKLPNENSALWNAMAHPLINMTIYGAIWYQGEANTVYNLNKYSCTFPAMIDDWRDKFHNGSGGETDSVFPFGFVQLAPNSPSSTSLGFPDIRWHQTADYGYVPNARMEKVFMAVALDLPDYTSPFGSIHPRDKQDVVARLTLSSLSVAYQKPGFLFQGPLPVHIEEGANNISVIYSIGIVYHNTIGFEAYCNVGKSKLNYWVPIPVLSAQAHSLVLWSRVCGPNEEIEGLRYLWKESPCPFKTCTVYSADNPLLPAPPFVLHKKMTGVQGTVHRIDWSSPSHL